MKIIIFGGTGFIGSALSSYWLNKGGYEIIIVTRKQKDEKRKIKHPSLSYITWDELKNSKFAHNDVKAVVNLAGATLSQLWTKKAKVNILESRLKTTKLVVNWLNSLQSKPEVIIHGSAVGIYGTSLIDEFNEGSETSSNDYLANVTRQWEDVADHGFVGIRLVKLRTGVVLGNHGGAYPLMALPYKVGFGGRIGNGKQWIPWIHLSDVVSLIDFCVSYHGISGAVNAVSPHPVTNNEFGIAISSVYHRPHWLPLPAFFLKAMLGDMSSLLLKGQKVLPQTALQNGFEFIYPTLNEAITDLRLNK